MQEDKTEAKEIEAKRLRRLARGGPIELWTDDYCFGTGDSVDSSYYTDHVDSHHMNKIAYLNQHGLARLTQNYTSKVEPLGQIIDIADALVDTIDYDVPDHAAFIEGAIAILEKLIDSPRVKVFCNVKTSICQKLSNDSNVFGKPVYEGICNLRSAIPYAAKASFDDILLPIDECNWRDYAEWRSAHWIADQVSSTYGTIKGVGLMWDFLLQYKAEIEVSLKARKTHLATGELDLRKLFQILKKEFALDNKGIYFGNTPAIILVNAYGSILKKFYDHHIVGVLSGVSNNNGQAFENDVSALFSSIGFNVLPTSVTGDFGVDILITEPVLGSIIALQCKDYKGEVGLKAVQEVFTGAAHYKANYSCVVTSNGFTPAALALARSTNTICVTFDELTNMLRLRTLDLFK